MNLTRTRSAPRTRAALAACALGFVMLCGCRSLGDRDVFNLYPLFEAERVNPPEFGHDRGGPYLRGIDDPRAPEDLEGDGYLARYDPVSGRYRDDRASTAQVSGLWPLGRYGHVPRQDPRVRVRALGPLFEYEQELLSGREYVAFHPLFSYENVPDEDRTTFHFLYPLGVFERDGDDTLIRLLPLFNYRSIATADGGTDEDFFLFPLVWYGNETHPPQFGRIAERMSRAPHRVRVEFSSEYAVAPGDQLAVIAPSGRRIAGFDVESIGPTIDGRKSAIGVVRAYFEQGNMQIGTGYRVSRRAQLDTYDPSEPADLDGIAQSYFALFPFGGTLRDFMLNEWMEFFLFPLFVHSISDGYQSWYLPWPIVHWGHGNGRESFMLFPLFSTDVRHEQVRLPDGTIDEQIRHRRYTFLWPLIHFQQNYDFRNVSDDPRNPRFENILVHEQFAVFPFYGYTWTPTYSQTTVLWPFFFVEKRPDEDYIAVDAPWPIFRYAEGIGRFELRVWPLFWTARNVDETGEHYALRLFWPIFWYDEDRSALTRATMFKVVPLFFHRAIEHLNPDTGAVEATSTTTKLWPLFGHRADRDGRVRWEFLSPLPTSDLPEWDNAWSALWRLFYYESSSRDEAVRWSALGPLLRYEREPTVERFDFFPLFQYRWARHQGRDAWEEESVDFLYGLFGWGEDREGSYMRLFWFLKIR